LDDPVVGATAANCRSLLESGLDLAHLVDEERERPA
jgi:hypothetical protein